MSRSNKCDNCGGSCEFDPSTQGLICKKCGALENFEESEVVKFHKFDMMTDIVEPEFSPQIHTLHCSNCGAIFKADTINISDNCQYCGASLTLDFTLSKASEPDGCIPFTFDEETAFNKFKDGIKRKWFLPNKFKKKLPKNSIESVYVPSYLFNVSSESSYVGRLYDTYRDSDGDSHRSYRKISGVENVYTKNIVVECSSKINQLTFDKIRPYDLEHIKKYSSEYIMGYSVEYFDKKLEESKSLVKQSVDVDVRRSILRGYDYDGIDYLNIKTTYKDCEYSRIILPTYRVLYKYGKKEYQTFINGQTGKVGGNLPRSKFKIFSFVFGIVAIIALLVWFFSM